MFSKRTLALGGLIGLVVGAMSLHTELYLPSEITQPAQAVTGSACDMNSNSTAAGIGVETPATEMQKKTCTPTSCWQTADGTTKCMVKPAAQAMAGGGGGLMDSIGQMLQKMLGGGGGGGGGDTGGGYQAPVDYEYGQKPVCSNFVSSSGAQPAQAGSSLLFTWTRTGGQTESVTLTPGVGVATVQSPVEFKAPSKSTTYTLTVANRSGSSTCTTRVFVGPPGSQITDPEDLAFLATMRQVDADTNVATGGQRAELQNPLGAKKSYSDLSQEESVKNAAPSPSATPEDATAARLLTPSDTNVTTQGVVEAGLVDAHAFDADPNAFVEENTFFGDTTTDAQVNGSGDLDALEARMRALMQAKAARANGTSVSTSTGTLPVDITGSLGIQYDAATTDTGEVQTGLFGRIGSWFSNTFCFWCVAPRTQGGAILLASLGTQPSAPVTAQTSSLTGKSGPAPQSEAKTPSLLEKLQDPFDSLARGDLNDTLTADCAQKNAAVAKAKCGALKDAALQKCMQGFSTYTDPKSIVPYEFYTFKGGSKVGDTSIKENPDTTTKTTGECKEKASAEQKCVQECQKSGYAQVSIMNKDDISGITKQGYKVCAETPSKSFVLVCREKKEAKSPSGGDGKTNPNGNPGPGGNPAPASSAGNGLMNSAMGQGLGQGAGQGLGQALGQMLSKLMGGGGQGGQGSQGAQPQDPCALANAMYNPACNPTLPTEAPTCSVGGGSDDALSASSSVIYSGQTSTLSWAVRGKGKITTIVLYKTTDETGREVTGSLGAVDGASGTKDVSPDRSASYTLKATNEIGSVTCAPVRIAVRPKTAADDVVASDDPLSARQLQVTCEPSSYTLGSGEQPTVSWDMCPTGTTSTFGTSTEDGAFSTGGAINGSDDVSPLRDATYVVRCRNQYNEELARASCRVDVTNQGQKVVETTSKTKPSVDIFVDNEDEVVDYGESVRVEWRSTGAASCVIYGPGCKRFGRSSNKCFKEIGRSGFVVGNIYETSNFVAECRGADRKSLATDEVVITVGADASATQSSAAQTQPSAEQVIPTSYDETSLDALLQGE